MTVFDELLKSAETLCNIYKTIPADAFRNGITYKSLLDNNEMRKKGYNDRLPLPCAMLPKEKIGDIYVGFYPVYYYDNGDIGIMAMYYSLKNKSNATFGPFRTGKAFADEMFKYSNTILFDFIRKNLKLYSDFAITYDNALMNMKAKISELPELPLMSCLEDTAFMGDSLEVMTEYILNPYCYAVPKVRIVKCDEFKREIISDICDIKEIFPMNKDIWEPLNQKRMRKIISKVRKAIKERNDNEKNLANEILNLSKINDKTKD